jgi:small nuclear ribonucleoprotein (snRNP)-like protein
MSNRISPPMDDVYEEESDNWITYNSADTRIINEQVIHNNVRFNNINNVIVDNIICSGIIEFNNCGIVSIRDGYFEDLLFYSSDGILKNVSQVMNIYLNNSRVVLYDSYVKGSLNVKDASILKLQDSGIEQSINIESSVDSEIRLLGIRQIID